MNAPSPRPLLLLLLLLAPLPGKAVDIPTTKGSGVKISTEPVFTNHSGEFVPAEVTISNQTGKDGRWQLTLQTGSFSDIRNLQVEAGQTRTFPLVLQANMPRHHRSYPNLFVTGPGTDGESSTYLHGSSDADLSIAFSQNLEVDILAPYRQHLQGTASHRHHTPNLSAFRPGALPGDWRALLGYRALVLADTDWATALSTEARNAVRQWVALGGHLLIATEADHVSLWGNTQARKEGPTTYLSGKVSHLPLKAGAANAALLDSSGKSGSNPSGTALFLKTRAKDNTPFVLIFSLAFAIVVGPVNLFFLAPPQRRQRLFLTTPLISLGGAVAILAFILFKDGVGGSGHRILFVRLLPDTHEAITTQWQTATTGLLLSRSFTPSDTSPVLIPQEITHEERFVRSPSGYHGDWFRSRREQQLQAIDIRPSRMAITPTSGPGEPLTIVSSIDTRLSTLFLRDTEGRYWQGRNILPGKKATLEPITAPPFIDWAKYAQQGQTLYGVRAFEAIVASVGNIGLAPGHFIADAPDDKTLLTSTLPSIRWVDTVLFAGPLAKAPSLPSAPTAP